MAIAGRPIRVALVSTADQSAPGSMLAYADTLIDALARYAPEVETERVELSCPRSAGVWASRRHTLALPYQAWRQRRRSPDVWHVLDGSRAYLEAGLGSAPVVVTVHDIIPWLQARDRFPGAPRQGLSARLLWRANGRALRRSAALVFDSRCSADDTQREFGVAEASGRVVPLPLRPSLANELGAVPKGERARGVVLHVGNNSFYKNRAKVLELFAGADPQLARRLVMSGEVPSAGLLSLADKLGISPRVEWVGDPDDRQLAIQYRQASVLLFPSLYEGFGWPVLEAMAFGLPVITSNTGSLPEVVGDAGVCLPLQDEAGLISELNRLLHSSEDSRDASALGLARAGLFSTATFAKTMHSTYVEALGSRGAPGRR